jgi:hypothetical protein
MWFNQPDTNDPSHRWFDRFAFPVSSTSSRTVIPHCQLRGGPDQRDRGLSRFLLDSIQRYYSRDVLDGNGYEIVHSQYLLCGIGFWQIGDPPWLARMSRLGFFRRWGAESFFIEHDWAPLPPTVMNGTVIDNISYNRLYGTPACYGVGQVPHPSPDHLFERVGEVMQLAQNPKAKLQYFQAMYRFIPMQEGT